MGILEFKSLVDKFRKGQCSVEELKQLENQLKNEGQVKEWMLRTIEQGNTDSLHDVNYNELFSRIRQQISAKSENKKRILQLPGTSVKWAAAFVLAFLIGGLASYFIFSESPVHQLNTFIEIVAPLGSKTEMILPDGSKVWLNAGTKLKYPNDFNLNNRDISLEGEAFFQVEKNKALPFVVNALGLDVKVVGTTFNVKAYESESTITTILVEGKVLLESEKYCFDKDIALLPSQKAVFSKNNKQLVIADVDDVYSEISWKDNLLIIKGENLSDLAVKLERKYNVAIHFGADDIKDYKFSGTLKDETIQQILDVIKFSAPIDYRMNGKEITLTTNAATKNSYNKILKKSN